MLKTIRRTQTDRPFPHRGLVPLAAAGFRAYLLYPSVAMSDKSDLLPCAGMLLTGTLTSSWLGRQFWICPVTPDAESGGWRAFRSLAGRGVLGSILAGTLVASVGFLLDWLPTGLKTPPLLVIPLAVLLAPLAAIVGLLGLLTGLLFPQNLSGFSTTAIYAAQGLCTAGLVAWLWKYYPIRQ
ncbi:MAG: hypothetical protein FJX77_03695 [Armatimonadetes bacterium]|nr:hypothetical protein [Armatimonadota bacterium]